jgi:O-antigen ligase
VNRPHPLAGVLSLAGWLALSVACSVILLPAHPLLNTCVWGASVLLFAAAAAAPLRSLPFAGLAIAVSGVFSLAFGFAHPVVVAPVPLAAYLAGSALRAMYDVERPPARHGLTPLWRAVAAAAALSALSAFVAARTSYLLVRSVPPPRAVSHLGLDAEHAVAGTTAALAALLLAAGFHALGVRAGRDLRGARLADAALVVVALAAGGTAILQKLGVVPHLRAPHWEAWGRAQSTFTDPSAAGVAAALLLAPCLARAASGPWLLRLGAGAGVAGLLVLLADAGSRGGFIGAIVSAVVLVLWAATRAAAGQKPGVRRRIALSAGTLSILVALAFGAALAWPTGEGNRSALLARISASFGRKEVPALPDSQRLVLYQGALALVREHPVTGRGLGSFRTEFPGAARDLLGTSVTFTDHPPSLYLGLLAEMGLAGGAVVVLFLAGLVSSLGGALSFRAERTEESLRAAGAASAVVGLLVIFLFGSHLVYPEIAAIVGLLTARLAAPPDGRSARLLGQLLPVAVAGASVLLVGGALARGVETWSADAAFAHAPTAGLWGTEREPDGRPFRWTAGAAALRIEAPAGRRSLLRLPVRNARPDGEPVRVTLYWNDVRRGTVDLLHGGWKVIQLPVGGPGVLRVVPARTFRPLVRTDGRRLGIETGVSAVVAAVP